MDWSLSKKSTRNICLKGCIQAQFKLVIPLTPPQWVDRGRDQRHRGKKTSYRFIWQMRLDSLYSHSKKNQPICIWRFSRGTFIRWLIRVIALGLQLAPLLNQGSQSSCLLPEIHWIIMAKSKGVRIIVTLECTECRTATAAEKRSPGVSLYNN